MHVGIRRQSVVGVHQSSPVLVYMYMYTVRVERAHACSGDIRGMLVISSRKTLASLIGTGLFGALLVQLYSILNR